MFKQFFDQNPGDNAPLRTRLVPAWDATAILNTMSTALDSLLAHYSLTGADLDAPQNPHPIAIAVNDGTRERLGAIAQEFGLDLGPLIRAHFIGSFPRAPAPYEAPPGEAVKTGKRRRQQWQVENREDLLDFYGLSELDIDDTAGRIQVQTLFEQETYKLLKRLAPLYGEAGAGWLLKVHVLGGIASTPPIPTEPEREPVKRKRAVIPSKVR